LVKRSEDIDTFDRVFGGFWLGQAADVWPAVLAVKERVGVELDPGTDTGAPRQQSDAVTAVPCYSAVEVLRRKDFGEYTADDFAEAQQLMSGLRATAATRRSRRRRPARWQRHKAPDIRATVRRALRTGVRLHDLRHTFAVLQLSAGVHFMQVSKWLGHSTFTLTLDVYGDYIPEEDGGAMNNLPEPPAPGRPEAPPSNVVSLFG
jgi:uncharacterized protein with von Willebrand factor type A (vWA) domain